MLNLKALVIDDSRVMRNVVMNALKQSRLANFEFTEAGVGVTQWTSLSVACAGAIRGLR